MRKICIILGLISAIIAVILSVLPLSNLAFIPAIAALAFGLIAFYYSNKNESSKKLIHYIFILTIMSLATATYKYVTSNTEVANTEALQEKEIESEEEAINDLEELDIDIEDINIEE